MGYGMRSETDSRGIQLAYLIPSQTVPPLELLRRVANVERRQKHGCGKSIPLQNRERLRVKIFKSIVECEGNYFRAISRVVPQPLYNRVESHGRISIFIKKTHLLGESLRRSCRLIVRVTMIVSIDGD